jgi:TonB family protein
MRRERRGQFCAWAEADRLTAILRDCSMESLPPSNSLTSMKYPWLAFVAVEFFALSTALHCTAQDVTGSPPAWFDPANAPEKPPQLKDRWRPACPEKMGNATGIDYLVVELQINADGQRGYTYLYSTNTLLLRALVDDIYRGIKLSPARTAGKSVDSVSWLAAIFNPATAALKKANATPRLLAVTPIVLPPALDAEIKEVNSQVWAQLSLDEKGGVQTMTLEPPASEKLLAPIEQALTQWRFAPARRAGNPVAADLRLPILLFHARSRVPKSQTEIVKPPVIPDKPAVVLYHPAPVYPRDMYDTKQRVEVQVVFTVTAAGRVENPVVVRSTNSGFNEAAIDAVLNWKFKPAETNGKPVDTQIRTPIFFEVYEVPHLGGNLPYISAEREVNLGKLPPVYRYDIAPKASAIVLPVYPYELRRDGVSGRAKAAFLINEHGRVQQIEIVEASRPEFGLALSAAVETCHFEPAVKNGRPSVAILVQAQEFRGSGSDASFSRENADMLQRERDQPESIVNVSQLDAPLKPIARPAPVFPLAASGENGEAVVEFVIDEAGHVRLPRVVSASAPAFGYAAVQAISTWRYEPPLVKGKPAVARVRVPFQFEIKPKKSDTPAPDQPK